MISVTDAHTHPKPQNIAWPCVDYPLSSETLGCQVSSLPDNSKKSQHQQWLWAKSEKIIKYSILVILKLILVTNSFMM